MMTDTDQVTTIVTRTDRLTMNGEDSWSAPGVSPAFLQPGGLWRLDSSTRTFVARLSKFLLVGGVGVLVNSVACFSSIRGRIYP